MVKTMHRFASNQKDHIHVVLQTEWQHKYGQYIIMVNEWLLEYSYKDICVA